MKGKGLTQKILIAMLLGIIVGLILNPMKDQVFVSDYLVGFIFVLLGSIFVALIKMMVVPLVFVSLTNGAAQMGDIKKLGRIGGKTLGFYLVTTAIAITIAITLASLMLPSFVDPMDLSGYTFEAKESPQLVQVLIGMIPTNPIDSMAKGNMLQIIIFALVSGTALSALGDKVDGIKRLLDELNEVILKMVMLIMKFAPYGVFALIAKTITQLGFDAIFDLGAYMICVILALFIHALVTYQGFLYGFTKLNPIQFYKKFAPAMMVAFSTSSSSATLPVTIDTVEKRLGVKRELCAFTLPLGATINMDGTAIMQGVATVFIAILYGVDLSMGDFLTVIITATLASIGTAGVPGVGLIMLSMVLTQVGLPVEAIALILGIDRILDMTRTAVNITGDAVCTVIVAKGENEFDESIYNAKGDVA